MTVTLRSSRRRTGTCAVHMAAVVVLVLFAPAGSASARDTSPVTLPQVRQLLEPGKPCTGPSPTSAAEHSWTRNALGLPKVWRLTKGEGVTVAVIDTGVSSGAPALLGRVEAVGGAGTDCVGHGTFAAGVIAAAPVAGSGVVGVAPAARILALRGTKERGAVDLSAMAATIRQAADRGAQVIYVGLALVGGRQELSAAVAYAHGKDSLVVAPAAVDTAAVQSPDAATAAPRPMWPAFAPHVLSVVDHGVGGTRPEKAAPVFAADLAAPGGLVVGIGPHGAGHYIGSGSSLAAAHAAGAAALLRSYNPVLSADETARRLEAYGYPATYPLLDPYASLTAIVPARAGVVPSEPVAHMAVPAPSQPRNRALVTAGCAVLALAAMAIAAAVVPRGRARGWLPGETLAAKGPQSSNGDDARPDSAT
ncbi:S8 family serine peptidase [Streptomyces zaomyceticus]|uniref:S8 family serine peptidase n=1 Tax=Streptomyces zaomyceticus TaxID=68286 RepID=UPI0036947D80